MKFSWLQLLPVIPLALAFFWIFKRIDKIRAGRKQPISESVLRPPGESTRLKVEELEEKLFNHILWLLVPACMSSIMGAVPLKNPLFSMIFVTLLVGIGCWFVAKRIVKILDDRSNYFLGFRGERVVGEALNQLREKGYRIYHDLQFEKFNIDHAMVGSGGVFCFETKTKRKILSKEGHRVSYDGKRLLLPNGTDFEDLKQAISNAKALKEYIAKAAAESVSVQPVLVLPGWFIDRKGRGPVMVVNHKELSQILPAAMILDADQIQRIAHQLEQKSLMEF